MRSYTSHKRVRASKIVAVTEFVLADDADKPDAQTSAVRLDMDDGESLREEIGKGILARYTPVVGDYLIQYEPEGYLSISPAKAFEDGYTLDAE